MQLAPPNLTSHLPKKIICLDFLLVPEEAYGLSWWSPLVCLESHVSTWSGEGVLAIIRPVTSALCPWKFLSPSKFLQARHRSADAPHFSPFVETSQCLRSSCCLGVNFWEAGGFEQQLARPQKQMGGNDELAITAPERLPCRGVDGTGQNEKGHFSASAERSRGKQSPDPKTGREEGQVTLHTGASFVQRTYRMPKDIHVEPQKFAAELINRLEEVLRDREAEAKLEERLKRVRAVSGAAAFAMPPVLGGEGQLPGDSREARWGGERRSWA